MTSKVAHNTENTLHSVPLRQTSYAHQMKTAFYAVLTYKELPQPIPKTSEPPCHATHGLNAGFHAANSFITEITTNFTEDPLCKTLPENGSGALRTTIAVVSYVRISTNISLSHDTRDRLGYASCQTLRTFQNCLHHFGSSTCRA